MLIIDELSMLDGRLFDKLEYIGKMLNIFFLYFCWFPLYFEFFFKSKTSLELVFYGKILNLEVVAAVYGISL